NRGVIRRLVAPPALPAFVGPRAAHGAEHVAPEDPRADPREAARREIVVDPCFSAFLAVHALPGAGMEEPVEELRPADAEGVLEILARPGAIPVDRDREAPDDQLRHGGPLALARRLFARRLFVERAQLALGRLQASALGPRQLAAGAIDVEREHRHRRAVRARFAPAASLGRALQGSRDGSWASGKNLALEIERVALARDTLRPASRRSRSTPAGSTHTAAPPTSIMPGGANQPRRNLQKTT